MSEKPAGTIVEFTSNLDFPEQDKRDFPWLRLKPRRYRIERMLNAGGFAIPYVAHPCDADGNRISDVDVVLKFPNLTHADAFPNAKVDARIDYADRKAEEEWRHVRRRLLTCIHANPIIDLTDDWSGNQRHIVTCQKFLKDYYSLDSWLVENKVKSLPYKRVDGTLDSTWLGINDSKKWIGLGHALATALADIQQHRIIHGDIWPPNIFLKGDWSNPFVMMIDFGEHMFFRPEASGFEKPDHAYRAPENAVIGCVATEQADVYSFGMLLLYLAVGIAEKIPDSEIMWSSRRRIVRDRLIKGNDKLLQDFPQVSDLISRCIAFDPVDRPTMATLRDEFSRYCRTSLSKSEQVKDMLRRGAEMSKKYAELFSNTRHVMRQLVDRRLEEMEQLLQSFGTEMIEVDGNREYLISILVSLFEELKKGDSWTAITTPSAWQADALGLDGRYATASVCALRREVSISRGLAISIEELGKDWCKALADEVRRECAGVPDAIGFADELDARITERSKPGVAERTFSDDIYRHNRMQFVSVLSSLRDIIDVWHLKDRLSKDSFSSVSTSQGMYFGIIIKKSAADVLSTRRTNPVAIMYTCMPDDIKDKWILVKLDVSSRVESNDRIPVPVLRRVRVYRTIEEGNYPKDRIFYLEGELRESVNVSRCIPQLANVGERLLDIHS